MGYPVPIFKPYPSAPQSPARTHSGSSCCLHDTLQARDKWDSERRKGSGGGRGGGKAKISSARAMPLPRKDESSVVWENGVSYLPPYSEILSLKQGAAAAAAASIDRAPEVCVVCTCICTPSLPRITDADGRKGAFGSNLLYLILRLCDLLRSSAFRILSTDMR